MAARLTAVKFRLRNSWHSIAEIGSTGCAGSIGYGFSLSTVAYYAIAVTWLLFLAQYDLVFLCGLAFFALLSAIYSTPEDRYKDAQEGAFEKAKKNHDGVTFYFLVGFLLLFIATGIQLNQPVASSFSSLFLWIETVTAFAGSGTFLVTLSYLLLMKRKGFDKISMPRLTLWLVGYLVCAVVITLLLAFSSSLRGA